MSGPQRGDWAGIQGLLGLAENFMLRVTGSHGGLLGEGHLLTLRSLRSGLEGGGCAGRRCTEHDGGSLPQTGQDMETGRDPFQVRTDRTSGWIGHEG